MSNQNLNPHTFQHTSTYYTENFTRVLTDDFPELKYRPRRPNEDRSTVHFGQRKLHLSEIEFLTNFCKEIERIEKDIVLIYAGAAPGIHLPKLSSMFPFIKLILVDPAKFQVKETDMIVTIQDFFTDDMAREMRKKYDNCTRLFISDIRLYGPGSTNEDHLEEKIEEDMAAQMRWYKILKPTKSMFKFRLPYIGEKLDRKIEMDYLDGEIYFQIFPAGSSSETRLVVGENAKIKTYNSIKYENQLFRFNQVERVLCYKHDVDVAGFDHCYDCRAEVYVFEEYLKLSDKLKLFSNNKIEIKSSVKEYMEELNDFLSAREKKFVITKDDKNYELRFTDVRYGMRFKDLCNDRTITHKGRRTYLSYSRPFNPTKSVYEDLKDNNRPILKRLGPKTIHINRTVIKNAI